jgi:hypothetical protein
MAELNNEIEQACRAAQEQAAHDIPYVEVGEARPFQYHYQSDRLYVEVDLQHHDPDQGAAVALYRVWRLPTGDLAAFKVDIRESEGASQEPSIANIATSAGDKDIDEWLERQAPDWRDVEKQAEIDLAAIQTDQDAYRFIEKYLSRELRAQFVVIYRSDRHEMNRSPQQAIKNLLSLPPL